MSLLTCLFVTNDVGDAEAVKDVFRVFLNYERFTHYPKAAWYVLLRADSMPCVNLSLGSAARFGYRWAKPEHFDYDKHFLKVRTHNDQQLYQYIDEVVCVLDCASFWPLIFWCTCNSSLAADYAEKDPRGRGRSAVGGAHHHEHAREIRAPRSHLAYRR